MTNGVRWAVFAGATILAVAAAFILFRAETNVDFRPWAGGGMALGICVAASVFHWPFSGPAT